MIKYDTPKKWFDATIVQIGVDTYTKHLLIQLPNNEMGCIYRDSIKSDKKYYELVNSKLRVRFLRHSKKLNIPEFTCRDYFDEGSIIQMKPKGKIIYEPESEIIKGYIFEDEFGMSSFVKETKFFKGKIAQQKMEQKKYFKFIVSNDSKDDKSYIQFFNLISPYFLTFNELCEDSPLSQLIKNYNHELVGQMNEQINQKNAQWIMTFDKLTSHIKHNFYNNKDFTQLSSLYSLHIKIKHYINTSGFLYTTTVRNKPGEELSQTQLIKKQEEYTKEKIKYYKIQSKLCKVFSEHQFTNLLDKQLNSLPDLIKINDEQKIFTLMVSMRFYVDRIEDGSVELDEKIIKLFEYYLNNIQKSDFYNEHSMDVIGTFMKFKKIIRNLIFKHTDIISDEFEKSQYLKFLILCVKLDYEFLEKNINENHQKEFEKVLNKSDLYRLRAYYETEKNKKRQLLYDSFEVFQFNENLDKVNLEFSKENISSNYREIYIRCGFIFESLSLLEDKNNNKIKLLESALSFNKRARVRRGFYLDALIQYLNFYESISIIKNLEQIIEIAAENYEKTRDWDNHEKFKVKYPAVLQFQDTYKLISLINSDKTESMEYLYQIYTKNLNSVKSTFSKINNLKLSKLIYANNLLLDVYSNKETLQNDIMTFIKNGLIEGNVHDYETSNKSLNRIMKNIKKGENIDIELKSTLLSETTNYEIKKCGPRTKMTNIPAKSFLESLNGYINSKNGGKIYLGISENKEDNNSPMIHGIEKDGYEGGDTFNNKLDNLVKDFIPEGNQRMKTDYITINEEKANQFGIPFDPKPKLQKFTQRTVCEITVEGYKDHPRLRIFKFMDKDGHIQKKYLQKTLHGEKELSSEEIYQFNR